MNRRLHPPDSTSLIEAITTPILPPATENVRSYIPKCYCLSVIVANKITAFLSSETSRGNVVSTEGETQQIEHCCKRDSTNRLFTIKVSVPPLFVDRFKSFPQATKQSVLNSVAQYIKLYYSSNHVRNCCGPH